MVSISPNLTTLPTEILVEILKYTVPDQDEKGREIPTATDDSWVEEKPRTTVRSGGYRHLRSLPGLELKPGLMDILLVSRSFNEAGIEAIYGHRLLKFSTANQLRKFVSRTNEVRRRCVKSIVVGMFWDQRTKKWFGDRPSEPVDHLDMDVLATLPSLQLAVIACAIRQAWAGDYTHRIPQEQAKEVRDAWKSKADVIRFTT